MAPKIVVIFLIYPRRLSGTVPQVLVSGISGNVTENHKECGMMTLVAAKRLLVDDLISDYTTLSYPFHIGVYH